MANKKLFIILLVSVIIILSLFLFFNQNPTIVSYFGEGVGTIFNSNIIDDALWGTLSGGAGGEVILNSPADNFFDTGLNSSFDFNCSAYVNSSTTVVNISLWTNMSGSWVLNDTTTYSTVALKEESGINCDAAIALFETATIFQDGQTFTSSSTSNLDKVGLYYKAPASVDDCVVYINETDAEGKPSTGLGQEAWNPASTEDSGEVCTNMDWENITFSPTIPLTSGEKYAVLVRCFDTGASFAGDMFVWGRNNSASGMGARISTTNFTTWAIYDTFDHMMGIYGSVQGPTNRTTVFSKEISTFNFDWTCQSCDDDGDCGYANEGNRTFGLAFRKNSETFTSSTTSGVMNPFVLDLETNGTKITVASLIYNGTSYTGSINSTGNLYTLTKNKIAPGVSAETNISFQWNISTSSGLNHLTTLQNQTVSPIVINGTCTGMHNIFNFTLLNEVTQAKIDASAKNSSIKIDLDLYTSDRTLQLLDYFHEFQLTNPVGICIDNDLSSGQVYSLDVQVEYSADDYATEFYNIERYVLKSSVLNNSINLFDLDDTNAQPFRLIIRDTSYLPIEGGLVRIERKYLENGTFLVTEIPKTDEKGITSASLEVNDVIYNFFIYEAGVLISSFTNVLAICQTPLVSQCEIDFNAFQSEITIPDFETSDDFNFTLGYNSTSKLISSQFVIPSGEPSLIQLTVISEDSLGTSVCSDTLTSSSGTLTCTVPSNFGNSSVIAKLYKDGSEIGKGNIKLDQKSSDIFGVALVFLSVLVMVTLIGIGVSDNPVVTAVFIFIGVILMFGINLIQNTGFYGATATILFFAIATILVIIKASRRS